MVWLTFRLSLSDSLSVPTGRIVNVSFEGVAGEDFCVVLASSSGKPVFAKPHEGDRGHSEFWARIGNATKQLHGDDMLEYRTNHWEQLTALAQEPEQVLVQNHARAPLVAAKAKTCRTVLPLVQPLPRAL